MNIFNFIFRRGGTERPAQFSLELSVPELRKEITRRKEAQVRDIYPICQNLAAEAYALIPKLRRIVENLKNKEIDKSIGGYGIAIQMRHKFVERMPQLLDELKSMNIANIQDVIRFNINLNNFIIAATKITSDNRYLFFFFNQEMKEFGKLMKEMCKISDDLKMRLESKKEVFDREGKIYAAVSRLESARSEFRKILCDIKNIEDEIDRDSERIAVLIDRIKEIDSKSSELRNRISDAEAEMDTLRNNLVDCLYILERPIKKFRRFVTEKWKQKLMEDLLSNPLKTYARSATGDKRLGIIFDELKIAASAGKLESDEKEIKKIVHAIEILKQESSMNSAARLSKIEEEILSINSELGRLEDLNREVTKEMNKFEKKKNEAQKHRGQMEIVKNRLEESINEVESLASDFLNRKISLAVYEKQ